MVLLACLVATLHGLPSAACSAVLNELERANARALGHILPQLVSRNPPMLRLDVVEALLVINYTIVCLLFVVLVFRTCYSGIVIVGEQLLSRRDRWQHALILHVRVRSISGLILFFSLAAHTGRRVLEAPRQVSFVEAP